MTEGTETLAAGTRVGDYTVEALLGRGGFGAVYAARRSDGGRCALKVSNGIAARLHARQLAWQQNEIEALVKLRHPSLVQVERFGVTEDGRFFLAMELVEGTRLDRYVGLRGRLDPIEAIQIARRIAEALAYCHAQGTLHLDLKPHNIIVTDPVAPQVKVLDFGMAQVREATGLGGTPPAAGTPGYMAPERFTDAPPTPRLDLYAVGTILFEMLTGRHPYEAATPAEIITRQVGGDAPSVRDYVPTIPEPLAELVAALLARDPALRFGSASLLCVRLKDLYYATLRGGDVVIGDAAWSSGPIAPEDAPFTGREAELALLAADAELLGAGPGRSALVVGEAGIGKSRLVAELLGARVRRDSIATHGRCRHIGELLPYAPLRELLGQLAVAAARLDGVRATRLRRELSSVLATEGPVLRALAPELEELAPRTGDDEPDDLSAYRLDGPERVARALRRVVGAVSVEVPVIAVVEDLHWADEGTHRVLERLLAERLPSGLLLLLTCRPFERAPRGPSLRTIELRPLREAENDALLLALVRSHDERLATALKRTIPLLATGNPLVTTQVVRDLEIEGHLRRADDGTALVDLDAIRGGYDPPDSVSRVLERILVRLDGRVLDVLGVGAVLGRQFLVSDLEGIGLFPAAAIRAALAEAERHCLARTRRGACQFVHDTIREHLEQTLPAEGLPAIHAAVARQLGRRGAPAAALARHLEHAGDLAGAARAYLDAGLDADRLHDPHGARRSLARAFELLLRLAHDARRPGELAHVTHELVRVGCVFGDTTETVRLLDRAAAALADPSPEERAALASSYARVYYVQGNMPKATEQSALALGLGGGEGRLRTYQTLPANVVGRAMCVSGRFAQAVRTLTRGSALAREAGEWAEVSHSDGLLAVALGFTGHEADGQARLESCRLLARRLGDPIRLIGAHVYAAALAESRGDWDAGVRETTQLLSFAEEHAIGGLYLYVGTALAGRHQFHVGHLDRARVLLGNALNLAELLHIGMLLAWTQAYLADVHFVLGQIDAAERHYRLGLQTAEARNGDDYATALCHAGLAHVAARHGDAAADVHRLTGAALAALDRAENVATRVVVLQRCAEALEQAGDVEAAERLLAERAALRARLGLEDADFWPRVPEAPVASPPASAAREYWQELTTLRDGVPRNVPATAYVSTQLALGSRELAGMTQRDPASGMTEMGEPGAPTTLFDSLATIEGFVPRF